MHDGHFVTRYNRFEFEYKFRGGIIGGDEHYRIARILSDPIFLAPYREYRHITDAQREFNQRLRSIRSRVETPFAWLKTTFKPLAHPWRYSLMQQEYLVTYATGIWNTL
jgi:hypothetical protein